MASLQDGGLINVGTPVAAFAQLAADWREWSCSKFLAQQLRHASLPGAPDPQRVYEREQRVE